LLHSTSLSPNLKRSGQDLASFTGLPQPQSAIRYVRMRQPLPRIWQINSQL